MIILTEGRNTFYGREGTTDEVVFAESWTENVYQLTKEDLRDTGVVVDLGANIGAFSSFAAYLGAKRVIAVEPEVNNFQLLKRNTEKWKVIQPIYVAVGAKRGQAVIVDKQGDSYVAEYDPTSTAQVIETVRLQDLLAEAEVTNADVLKIDVEGSEYNIIAACPLDVLQKFRYITMEFHATGDETFGRMVAKLSRAFNIHIIGSHRKGGQLYAKLY